MVGRRVSVVASRFRSRSPAPAPAPIAPCFDHPSAVVSLIAAARQCLTTTASRCRCRSRSRSRPRAALMLPARACACAIALPQPCNPCSAPLRAARPSGHDVLSTSDFGSVVRLSVAPLLRHVIIIIVVVVAAVLSSRPKHFLNPLTSPRSNGLQAIAPHRIFVLASSFASLRLASLTRLALAILQTSLSLSTDQPLSQSGKTRPPRTGTSRVPLLVATSTCVPPAGTVVAARRVTAPRPAAVAAETEAGE